MSMVTSYTLLSRPAPLRKITSTPMQARKLAAAPAVALPLVGRKPLSLSMCHAYTYDDVPPFALVHPKFVSPKDKNCWNIEEEADHITLLFNVGEMKNDLQVAIKGNLLLIRSPAEKKEGGTTSPPPPPPPPASKLDVRLLLPSGYAEDPEKKVKAELTLGSVLKVTVAKPVLEPKEIKIIVPPPSSNQQA
ncbi:hypothetical protein HU200_013685 [Digitaria exilis]|uniref:SHSP domain-containing protein n=1 Tax=Digitaria exilis TaxID=1010633 RepID=A0A835FD07_9POAL|nr:hypothetical protein HU200_013685 [Digitaria exilis]CAB3452275.1 unnamed protein product [Digitaria exilis]